MRRMLPASGAVALALACAFPALAAADTPFTIDSQANPWGAGHASTSGVGGGSLPVEVDLPGGTNRVISFPSVTGSVSCNGSDPAVGPDGGAGCGEDSTDLSGVGGIAGIASAHGMYLTGVFVGSGEPADPQPARLTFPDDASEDFSQLSPGLAQPFFIGDGQSSSGTQSFRVPDGANRLYLGIDDGCGSSAYHGAPGCFTDNTGSFDATVRVNYLLDSRTATTSTATPATEGLSMDDGVRYVVTVEGTFSAYRPKYMTAAARGWVLCGDPAQALMPSPGAAVSPTGQDAEYVFARPQWHNCDPNFTFPHHYGKKAPAIVIDNGDGTGFRHYAPLGSGPSADHMYSYEVVGTGNPVHVELRDSQTMDNFGVLRITIQSELG
jgi:hypothetical protein